MRNKQATEALDSYALQVAQDSTPLEHTLFVWGTRHQPHEGVLSGEGDAAAHTGGDEAEGQDITTQTPPQYRRAHRALSRPRTWKLANTTGLKKIPLELQGQKNTSEGS
jgi:hypothetical protein